MPPLAAPSAISAIPIPCLRAPGELLLADFGPIAPDFLPAHGHGDVGSFEWSLAGKRIIVDHGVYEYAAGDWRALSRSTRAHNTLTLDDEDQCEFWSSFRVGRRVRILERGVAPIQEKTADKDPDAWAPGFVLDGTHDGFAHLAGRPLHHRSILATPGHVVIQDEVRGGAGQLAVARLLFHPDCQVEIEGDRFEVRRDDIVLHGTINSGTDAPASTESATPSTPSRLRLVDAWWCPDFGVKHATKQLEFEIGRAPCSGSMELSTEPR